MQILANHLLQIAIVPIAVVIGANLGLLVIGLCIADRETERRQ